MDKDFDDYELADFIQEGLIVVKDGTLGKVHIATYEFLKKFGDEVDVEINDEEIEVYGFAYFPLEAFETNKIGLVVRVHPSGNWDVLDRLESLPGAEFNAEEILMLANEFKRGNYQDFQLKPNYFSVGWDG